MAEALFDLACAFGGTPSAKAEEEEGPDGPKRKRPRPAKRDDAEDTPTAAPGRKPAAVDASPGARKLERRGEAPDAARRAGASAGGAAGRDTRAAADAYRASGARVAADGARSAIAWHPTCACADGKRFPVPLLSAATQAPWLARA